MMSTIQAIAFRRNKLGEVRKTFSEIERPGVYILIGEDESEPDRQLAYIGESEAIGERLGTHNSNKAGRDTKEFWTDTVVLISKYENLTKSHARYVEACLIRSTGNNPRWSLPNSNMPSENAGKLPLPDRAAMDEFVDQTVPIRLLQTTATSGTEIHCSCWKSPKCGICLRQPDRHGSNQDAGWRTGLGPFPRSTRSTKRTPTICL